MTREYERFEQRVACETVSAVNTGMRAFTAGIEVRKRGLGVFVNVDAAHEIVLTREYRHRLFCEVEALIEQVLVYHREALFEEVAVLVAYVEVEVGRILLARFEDYRVRYYVTRSKLEALVVVLHEALLVAVEEVCALAAYSLGDEEAFAGSAVVEGCRVELHVAEVLYLRAHFVCECDTVAGSDRGIGRELVNSADTACCEYHEVAVGSEVGIVLLFKESGVAGRGLFHAAHDSILHYSHVRESFHMVEQGSSYSLACGIGVVEDTVVAVTAFESAVISAVGVLVEVNAELDDTLDILSGFTYESVNCGNVVLESACDEGIVLVILDIIRRGELYTPAIPP